MVEICGSGFIGSGLFSRYTRDQVDVRYTNEIIRVAQTEIDEGHVHNLYKDKVTVFINASGPTSIERSFNSPNEFKIMPALQVFNHLNFLNRLKSPPHYIYISSSSVYGDCSRSIPTENSKLNPMSPYSEGKIEAEDTLKKCAEWYRGKLTVLRATSVFSEELNNRVLGLIKKNIGSGENIDLFGTGDETRDFLHLDDFRLALDIISAQFEREKYEVFNIGSGLSLKISKVAELAREVAITKFGYDPRITFNRQHRIGDPLAMSINIEKLIQIGWTPQQLGESAISKYFASNIY